MVQEWSGCVSMAELRIDKAVEGVRAYGPEILSRVVTA